MGWSAKKMKAIKDATAKPKPREDWTAGDRIGKVSAGVLRDLRIRAELYGEAPTDRFVALVEVLEELLDLARDEENESMVVVEELPDLVRKLREQRDNADTEKADAERACDEQIADVKKAGDDALAEHETEMADLAKTADEYRARAEKAEHDLTEAVRNGHGLDQESADRIRRVESERNALLEAAKEAIPEGEHPADPTIVHDWAWQVKKLGEDRRAIYKHKAEAEARARKAEAEVAEGRSNVELALERRKVAEVALATERTATKQLEVALERQRALTPMRKRAK